MFLVYKPEGQEEPTRWRYNPRKIMSAERENIERLTGRDWTEFTSAVLKNSLCRRALLFTFLKREHPTLKFDDVEFAWDEVDIEYSRGELIELRKAVAEGASAEQRPTLLAAFDEEIAKAAEDPEEEGKAQLPVAG